MKENVKVFLIALVIGMIAAFVVCYKFDNTIFSNALETKVSYFVVGTYNNKEDALEKSKNVNTSIIYDKNGIYEVVIGAYNKKETISLMESYFNDLGYHYKIGTLKVDNDFIRKIDTYESLIKTSDKKYFKELNASILKEFSLYIN